MGEKELNDRKRESGGWRQRVRAWEGKKIKCSVRTGKERSKKKTKCAETQSREINRETERQRRKYNDDTNFELATGRERNIFSSGTLLT